MYGDHYGISDNHNAAMSKVIGKEMNSFENAQLQRVPLIVRVRCERWRATSIRR